MANKNDYLNYKPYHKKKLDVIEEEILEEAKKADSYSSNVQKQFKSYDITEALFTPSKSSADLNSRLISTNVNFELNDVKVFNALQRKNSFNYRSGRAQVADLKFLQREASSMYAVFDKNSNRYFLGYKDSKGREHLLETIELDKNDVINLKKGKGIERTEDKRLFFKGRLSKLNIRRNDRIVQWIRKNTIFKGHVSRFSSQVSAKVRSSIRNAASRFIGQPLKALGNKLFGNAAALLKNALASFASWLAGLLANPYVLIPLILVVIISLVLFSASPTFASADTGYGEEEKADTFLFLNASYEQWDEYAKEMSDTYGVYFNVVDAYALSLNSFPDLLVNYFDENDENIFEQFTYGWEVTEEKMANDILLSMLGPMETRTEYYHRVWGDWNNGFKEKPSFDQIRTYTLWEDVWVEEEVETGRQCFARLDFGLIEYDITSNETCPRGFSLNVDTEVQGHFEQQEIQYWDGRNIIDSWWDIDSNNVANKNDGVENTEKYTYDNPDDPIQEMANCKDCSIENIVLDNGDYTRLVDYWTLYNWDEIKDIYFDNKPVGSEFVKYLELDSFRQVNEVEESIYGSYLNGLTYVSSDQDFSINKSLFAISFYADKDYRRAASDLEDAYWDKYFNDMDNTRSFVADYFGAGQYNLSMIGKFNNPIKLTYSPTITSRFGMRLIGGKWVFHTGLDLATVSSNTPIYSTMNNGVVETVSNTCPTNGTGYGDTCGGIGNFVGTGNHVVVKYSVNTTRGERTDLYVLYAHLAQDSIMVSVGDFVDADTMLGVMGSSGSSTGTHLHLAVFVKNDDGSFGYLNPEYMIR